MRRLKKLEWLRKVEDSAPSWWSVEISPLTRKTDRILDVVAENDLFNAGGFKCWEGGDFFNDLLMFPEDE